MRPLRAARGRPPRPVASDDQQQQRERPQPPRVRRSSIGRVGSPTPSPAPGRAATRARSASGSVTASASPSAIAARPDGQHRRARAPPAPATRSPRSARPPPCTPSRSPRVTAGSPLAKQVAATKRERGRRQSMATRTGSRGAERTGPPSREAHERAGSRPRRHADDAARAQRAIRGGRCRRRLASDRDPRRRRRVTARASTSTRVPSASIVAVGLPDAAAPSFERRQRDDPARPAATRRESAGRRRPRGIARTLRSSIEPRWKSEITTISRRDGGVAASHSAARAIPSAQIGRLEAPCRRRRRASAGPPAARRSPVGHAAAVSTTTAARRRASHCASRHGVRTSGCAAASDRRRHDQSRSSSRPNPTAGET